MKLKRFLSVFLAFVMVVGILPLQISAQTNLTFNETQANINTITAGALSLSKLYLYKGSDKSSALPIVSAVQDGNTFNIVLEADTKLPLTIGYSFNAGSISPANYTLNSRTGSQKATVTGVGMGAPNMWPKIPVTFNFSLAEGISYPVTLPSNTVGFTVVGAEKVYEGDDYRFTVNINEGYDASDMVVMVNGEIIHGTDGAFTVENVLRELDITVSGVVAKEKYDVVLNSGEGYTITSTDTPYKNEDYTFKVTIDQVNYKIADDGMKVLVNGLENKAVDNEDGTYTIFSLDSNISITVDGIAERELFEVIKPNVHGVTFNGDNTVREGSDYTFTVSAKNGYTAEDIVVTVNGTQLTESNGTYTLLFTATDGKETAQHR